MQQTVILLLTASPDDAAYLQVGREIKQIEQGLRLGSLRDNFIFKSSHATTVPDLRRAIQQHKPQIVHFSGHGDGEAGLCFENSQGMIQLVQTDALSDFFKHLSAQIECVVLNACYSEVQAEAIARHIDYVIGMTDSITDQAAIAFAVAFYESLANEEPIESAYKFACTELALLNLKEEHIPKLIRRAPTANDSWRPEMQSTKQSNTQDKTECIRQLIAQDKLDKALTEFLSLAEKSNDNDTSQELIVHQAKLTKTTKERRRGLINSDKDEQVRNQIRYALLDLLNEQSDM
ncbi:MAG: CHAT domain-containing protein [Candidatus Electrothrix sp. AUS4]|nr:CHAT domain-containing protein [Candidatus Electrothrix sp. AUS4]